MKATPKLFIICSVLVAHSACWSDSYLVVDLHFSNLSPTSWTGANGANPVCHYKWSTSSSFSNKTMSKIPANTPDTVYQIQSYHYDNSHYLSNWNCDFYNSSTGDKVTLSITFNSSNGTFSNIDATQDKEYYYSCSDFQTGRGCSNCVAYGTFGSVTIPLSSTVTWNTNAASVTTVSAAQGQAIVTNLAEQLESSLGDVESVVGQYNPSAKEFTLTIDGGESCQANSTCTNPYNPNSTTCAYL